MPLCLCASEKVWETVRVTGKEKWTLLGRVRLSCHSMDCPWNSLGQNTGVGSLSLLQGIFLTQGSNPGFPHHKQILYQLSHQGSPRILEWVAYPFSRGSSQPGNQTRVSCTVGRFFTNWAIREACRQGSDWYLIRAEGEAGRIRDHDLGEKASGRELLRLINVDLTIVLESAGTGEFKTNYRETMQMPEFSFLSSHHHLIWGFYDDVVWCWEKSKYE